MKDLVGEHCEGYVFICQIKDEDSGEVRTPLTWDGGFNTALGMADRAHTLMKQEALDANKPEVPKDDDGGRLEGCEEKSQPEWLGGASTVNIAHAWGI